MGCKIKVAKVWEIPSRGGLPVQVMGRSIALFRLGPGVRAVDERCPHQGASLAGGEIEGSAVICPLHRWEFCLETGRGATADMDRIRTYPVVLEGDQVYIEWLDT